MKKLFTLLTLLVAIVTGAWADDPVFGEANSICLDISKYSTITTATFTSNLTKLYDYDSSNGVLVVNAYGAMNSTGQQKWVTVDGSGSATRDAWSASGVFKGTEFYGYQSGAISNSKYRVNALNSTRKTILEVTNCTKVSALVKSGGTGEGRYVILSAYDMNADGTARVSDTSEKSKNGTNSNTIETISIENLDAAKIYQIVLTGGLSDNSDLYEIAFYTPTGPTITTQPTSANYMSNASATALSVVATASAGNLSYQWKSCTDANKTGAAPIENETSSTYTPSTASVGTFYYYCTVTDENGSKDSDVATITVENAAALGISLSGTSYSTTKGTAVTFTATTTGVPTPTVTWYQSETETTSGGTEKGTGSTFNPDVTTKGTFYYYAIASNSQGNATSEVITLTVTDPNKVVSGNSYYIEENETPVPDESIICNDITMTFVNGKAGESFTESVEDNHINDINSNYQYSISGSSGNNGWKAQFAPTVSGILKVGVIINNNKTFSITNVTSFSYKGFNNKSTDPDDVSETISGNSFKTGETTADKLYVEVTINAVAGTEYAFSVAGSKMGFYGFEFTPVVSSTITASGYNTYSTNYPVDLSTITGGTAYVATGVTDGKIVLTKCTSKVPAATGLFIAGTAGEPFTISTTADETSAPATNLLVAMPNGGTVPKADEGKFNYVFGWTEASNPGFYLINSTAATLGAFKAYLQTTNALSATTLARMSFVFADELTGISQVENKTKSVDGAIYNLSGQRIAQPTKGLYIVNGKKVIIK